MRSLLVLVFSLLFLLVNGATVSLHAEEHDYFTVSGGWSWPVAGPVHDSYESGLTLAASFRVGVVPNYLSGFEVGYSWFALDTAKLEAANPGSTYTGGDMGLLSITTENDYIFGAPTNSLRPFFNLGLGFYRSFIDDAAVTTDSGTESYWTGVYKGSFFGFHLGVGTLIVRDRFGLRLDANYQYLFAGGPDLEFFTARAGFIFYLQPQSREVTESKG